MSFKRLEASGSQLLSRAKVAVKGTDKPAYVLIFSLARSFSVRIHKARHLALR